MIINRKCFFVIIIASVCLLLNFCKQARRGELDAKQEKTEKLEFVEVMEEEFKKEGFITPHMFRVVVIEPIEYVMTRDYAMETAKKRAFLMLKKHLLSENRIVTSNVDATLLGIVERDGILKKIDDIKKTRNVYFYEIKKEGLRQYVESLAPKR